ncbi:MAG: amino acid decarboxylase [Acidobacteria bacterium]|nr:amino acid decarboxylase [Acidobacteriota bacterium]
MKPLALAPEGSPLEGAPELSLDPEDWTSFRELVRRAADEMMDYLETVRERPAWQRVPSQVQARFEAPPPVEGMEAARVYEEFRESILPFPEGNIHPRFWGWVIGTGTPVGVLAEMLAATMNTPVPGFEQSAYYVERQVMDWLRQLFLMPPEASGILVSGGSAANLIGLAVARNQKAGIDVRTEGLAAAGVAPMRVYASAETHSSVQKAVELLGLGSRSLVLLPVGEDFRLDLGALREAVREDRRRGFRPFCVVGNAGTTNTGAVDDLAILADFCAAEDLWFHVDGAFGATAALSPRLRPLLQGMERADSLAFDLHKWAAMPYEVGGVFVRDAGAHARAFSLHAEYLNSLEAGASGNGTPFADLGLQLSRGFRALKVWMSVKTFGLARMAAILEQNVDQARHLAALVQEHPRLQLLAPAGLNVVAFRYAAPGLREAALDALNARLLLDLQESGFAVPSGTTLRGRFALRVASVNHRSRREDFAALVREVARRGDALAAGPEPGRDRPGG